MRFYYEFLIINLNDLKKVSFGSRLPPAKYYEIRNKIIKQRVRRWQGNTILCYFCYLSLGFSLFAIFVLFFLLFHLLFPYFSIFYITLYFLYYFTTDPSHYVATACYSNLQNQSNRIKITPNELIDKYFNPINYFNL